MYTHVTTQSRKMCASGEMSSFIWYFHFTVEFKKIWSYTQTTAWVSSVKSQLNQLKLGQLVIWTNWGNSLCIERQTHSVYAAKLTKVRTCWLQTGKHSSIPAFHTLRTKGLITDSSKCVLRQSWLYWSSHSSHHFHNFITTCKSNKNLHPFPKEKFPTHWDKQTYTPQGIQLYFLNR